MLIPSTLTEISPLPAPAASLLYSLRIQVNDKLLSVVERAENWHTICDDFDRWVATVRDPAIEANEGVRTVGSRAIGAEASYEIAPLPDGRYALTFDLWYATGNCSGYGSPWEVYDTRESCVEAFLDAAR